MTTGDHVTQNHAFWERTSESYQEKHEGMLSTTAAGWGVWQIPEAELHVLGNVRGKDVLEFGCGGAQWSLCLARQGARPVGLDFSASQLRHALRVQELTDVRFPLVNASAEDVPLRDASFDIVFCDWGAMTFADPARTLPEVSRLLRPGGLLAFSTGSPLSFICWPAGVEQIDDRLHESYFDLGRFEEESIVFPLTYSGWIRLFRQNALAIDDLIEPRPPANADSTYRTEHDRDWSRRWPAEIIWKVRKG